ncbi:MAG: hypothetical protein WC422_03905 [Candidatus Paceibacterota bacterium]|jgi:hypothetical protein
MSEKIIRGVSVIFYKDVGGQRLYLTIFNTKTNNVSFTSGAQDEEDGGDLFKTANREIKEELDINSDEYVLHPTDIINSFIFDKYKTEREGYRAEYHVFYADISNIKREIFQMEESKYVK